VWNCTARPREKLGGPARPRCDADPTQTGIRRTPNTQHQAARRGQPPHPRPPGSENGPFAPAGRRKQQQAGDSVTRPRPSGGGRQLVPGGPVRGRGVRPRRHGDRGRAVPGAAAGPAPGTVHGSRPVGRWTALSQLPRLEITDIARARSRGGPRCEGETRPGWFGKLEPHRTAKKPGAGAATPPPGVGRPMDRSRTTAVATMAGRATASMASRRRRPAGSDVPGPGGQFPCETIANVIVKRFSPPPWGGRQNREGVSWASTPADRW